LICAKFVVNILKLQTVKQSGRVFGASCRCLDVTPVYLSGPSFQVLEIEHLHVGGERYDRHINCTCLMQTDRFAVARVAAEIYHDATPRCHGERTKSPHGQNSPILNDTPRTKSLPPV